MLWALLALFLPMRAEGQAWEDYDYEHLQFRGVGLEAGRVFPRQIEPDVSFGLRGDLGYAGPHVRVSPSIRYWSSSLRGVEVQRLADRIVRICERQASATCPSALNLGRVRRSDLEISLDAHYLFRAPGKASPYTGGGFGLHLLNGRGEFIDGTFVEDLLDTLAPGASLLAGLDLPLGSSIQLLGEGRLVITSDVQYANLVFGAMFTLPTPPARPGAGGRAQEAS